MVVVIDMVCQYQMGSGYDCGIFRPKMCNKERSGRCIGSLGVVHSEFLFSVYITEANYYFFD